MNDTTITSRLRSLLFEGEEKGPYHHVFNVNSLELKDLTGRGALHVSLYYTDPDINKARKYFKSKQAVINAEWLAKKGGDKSKGDSIDSKVESSGVRLPISDTVTRQGLSILFNKGTDTTTIAIIGSSFAAGKTTIMMNHIMPMFYGAKVTGSNSKVSKQVISPASVSKKETPYKKIRYINSLFALNTHIKAYKGYTDLIKVTGFDDEQQQLIRDMHQINVKTENKYRFALFIDDILNVKHSKMLENCYMTYRNAEISTCVCMQHLKFLSPAMRGNIQNLIFCKLMSEEAIEAVLNVYLRTYFNRLGIPRSDHVQFYRDMTDKFHTIHLHQGTESIRFCSPVKYSKR